MLIIEMPSIYPYGSGNHLLASLPHRQYQLDFGLENIDLERFPK
jgi:hypothetical protein